MQINNSIFGFIYPLTSICNCSLREGVLPNAWKSANIIPLQKISDRIMTMKLVAENTMLHVILVYANQVQFSQQENVSSMRTWRAK